MGPDHDRMIVSLKESLMSSRIKRNRPRNEWELRRNRDRFDIIWPNHDRMPVCLGESPVQTGFQRNRVRIEWESSENRVRIEKESRPIWPNLTKPWQNARRSWGINGCGCGLGGGGACVFSPTRSLTPPPQSPTHTYRTPAELGYWWGPNAHSGASLGAGEDAGRTLAGSQCWCRHSTHNGASLGVGEDVGGTLAEYQFWWRHSTHNGTSLGAGEGAGLRLETLIGCWVGCVSVGVGGGCRTGVSEGVGWRRNQPPSPVPTPIDSSRETGIFPWFGQIKSIRSRFLLNSHSILTRFSLNSAGILFEPGIPQERRVFSRHASRFGLSSHGMADGFCS